MKILVCSDLHLGGTHYRKFNKNGLNEYMLSNFKNFNYIVEYVENNDIDAVVVPGDIFDKSNISTVALMKAKEGFTRLLKACNGEVYTIKGNHDKSDILDSEGYTAIDLLETNNFNNKANCVDLDGVNFVFVPWGVEVTSDLIDNSKKNVLVAHGYPKNYFNNDNSKDNDGVLDKDITEQFDMVLTGHYHTTDEFKVGKTQYINPGSISPSTTNTKNTGHVPCFYIIDTSDLSFEKKIIEGSTKIIHADVVDVDDYLNSIGKDDNNIYRIRSERAPGRKQLIKAQKNALDIQVIVETKEREEIKKIDDFWEFIDKEYPQYREEFKEIIV